MKFVVRENITGKMGTFETKFTVPDLSADTSGLKLSTVIWSSQREKVAAAVGSAEKITRKDMDRQSPDRRRRKGHSQHHQALPPQPDPLRQFRRLRRPP